MKRKVKKIRTQKVYSVCLKWGNGSIVIFETPNPKQAEEYFYKNSELDLKIDVFRETARQDGGVLRQRIGRMIYPGDPDPQGITIIK